MGERMGSHRTFPDAGFRQYNCPRCEVQWFGSVGAALANVCWCCGSNQDVFMTMQTGQPVRYYAPAEGATSDG